MLELAEKKPTANAALIQRASVSECGPVASRSLLNQSRFSRFVCSFVLFCGVFFASAQEQPLPTSDQTTEKTQPAKVEQATEETQPAKVEQAEPESIPEATVDGAKVRHKTHRQAQTHRSHRSSHEEKVEVREDMLVPKGQTNGDIVVIAGNLKMEGEVDGNVVAIASKAYINGPIRGDLVVVPGPVTFGPNAEVEGEAVVVGDYHADPAAKFQRGFRPVKMPEIVPIVGGAKDFFFQGVILARPLPPKVPWVWVVHGIMVLALITLAMLFPQPVAVGAKAIADRPVVSMFSGFLTAILFIPVLVLLIATVIGIIAVPFAIVGLLLASMFGKAAVLEFVGQQIGRNLRVAMFESPLVAILIGAILISILYMVPVLGFLIWGVATLLGLGAIMVAAASALSNRPSEPTPTISVQPIAPAPATVTPAIDPLAPVAPPIPTPMVLHRVGFWKRFFAAALDWIMLGILVPVTHGLLAPFFPLLLIGYFVAMWTWKGTSIGKICLGLKIVRTDGSDISFGVALVRSLAACFSFMVLFLGFFWAGWDRQKQSWHDKIAGTVVVQVPKGVSLL